MKIHVVYDDRGKIISINTLMPASLDPRSPQFGVDLKKGQHSADLEVPEKYSGWGLVDIGERLQVNIAVTPPILTMKNA